MPRSLAGASQKMREMMRARGRLRDNLLEAEEVWASRAELLKKRGYILRPRYQEGWRPSWNEPQNADMVPSDFEDYIALKPPPGIIDAYEARPPHRLVCIKRVHTESDELKIMIDLNRMRDDPRNHCVPLLEWFQDDENENLSYIVMPFLRVVDSPPFETVGQVMDFVTQLLEGLTFLHSHNVAHRDCEYHNIMMDANALFPDGFHPVETEYDPSYSHRVQSRPRRDVDIKYYFIDFGLSVQVSPPVNENKYVLGIFGRDDSVPELSLTMPYDAFKVDIYTVGNMLKQIFLQKCRNTDFLSPLVELTTTPDPAARPTAVELEEWWTRYRRDILIPDGNADEIIVPLDFPSRRIPMHSGRPRTESPQHAEGETLGVLGLALYVGKSLFKWLADLSG